MSSIRGKKIPSNFSEIAISLASPKDILANSYGEVTEPETKNHRTYSSEPRGLFCQGIFGPEENYQCACGKYKGIKYKYNVCDKCGVEINEKKVRRERMGHIKLAAPVVHTWFFRYLPNKIATLLGVSGKKIENVIYYSSYVVIQPGIKAKEGLNEMDFLTQKEYDSHLATTPLSNQVLPDMSPNKFIAKMGAEAIEMLLQRLDLDSLAEKLKEQITNETSQQRKENAIKRLMLVDSFRNSARNGIENKPEWMILRYIPVIPPGIRPIFPLSNGKFATSDIVGTLKRLIVRNNRLKRLCDLKAPEIILLHEKRMLQEIVDALIDNKDRVNPITTENGRPLKSLSSNLKGKSGRFRLNLLGKRVDFSGRSVIVVGPDLKLHECGLPKEMALTLFRPFVIQKLRNRGVVKTFKEAQKLIDKKLPIVWDILEGQLKSHPVLLNRAPTLHKLSIQAFQPKLIEGKAIQLHPLVCAAFNADFDGDQMAVHVPLSQEAIAEASMLMLSSNNVLDPCNGEPIIVPSKDMVLGYYYITKGKDSTPDQPVLGEGIIFSDPEEIIVALDNRKVSKHAKVKVKAKILGDDGIMRTEVIDTVAGRAIFNQCIPEELGFINELIDSKKIRAIVAKVYQKIGIERTAIFLDKVKALGFKYAHEGGLTFGLDDIKIPKEKKAMIEKSEKAVEHISDNYFMGIITNTERYNQVVDIWTKTNIDLTKVLIKNLKEDQGGFNSIYIMMDSGARGSREQVRQIAGMKGLIAKPNNSGGEGAVIEDPVLSNLLEGLDIQSYFLSTQGGRKGFCDGALRTSDAGYLGRKLADVAQAIIVREEDCNTLRGRQIKPLYESGKLKVALGDKIVGRITAKRVIDPNTQELIAEKGILITAEIAKKIDESYIKFVEVRSPLYCKTVQGVCIKCYGEDLSTRNMVQIGEAVGIIAANSIGQPGTQLTLRTFHTGGAASNISVKDVQEAPEEGTVRITDLKKVQRPNEEGVTVVNKRAQLEIISSKSKDTVETYIIPYGASLFVEDGQKVKEKEKLFKWDPYNGFILSDISGTVQFESVEVGVTYKEEYDEQTGYKEKIIIESKNSNKMPNLIIENDAGERKAYRIPVKAHLSVDEGERVVEGQVLAKIPRPKNVHYDITGGLPRVTELLEARNPSSAAVVNEVEGIVTYGAQKRRNQEIIVTSKDGKERKYKVPLSKQLLVQDGDYIKACTPLCTGLVSTAKILEIKGYAALYDYIIDAIQEVYRLQAVKINDKHIEIIVRQMMQKVEVVSSGDTYLLAKQLVQKEDFDKVNATITAKKIVTAIGGTKLKVGQIVTSLELEDENKQAKEKDLQPAKARWAKPATGKPKLQGITRASINSPSFISAASFQETIKVLVNAAISAKIDPLIGLKENVIVGKLIPAGTGRRKYKNLRVTSKEIEEALVQEQYKKLNKEGTESIAITT